MTASAEARYIVQEHKPFCSRQTLLLSGGQVTHRGEDALEEYLRRRPRLEATS